MKKRFTFLMLLTLIGLSTLTAQIINIPADYPTIQQGIDASLNGDTVLVQPGTYFEPIIYNAKGITVCSKYLTTGDKNYIEQTIINGTTNDLPCVRFIDGGNCGAKLIGFTIQNGYTTSYQFGAGVYISHSSAVLDHLIIKNNNYQQGAGGGIHCFYASGIVKITNTLIENNIGGSGGGGIYLFSTVAEITNCEFRNNSGYEGAAISMYRANIKIINSVIHNNNGYNAIAIIEDAKISIINSVISNNNTPIGIALHPSTSAVPKMINSIVSGHTEYNIQIPPGNGPFYIDYSLIEGGIESIGFDNPNQLYYYEHNIDANPEFINPSENNYALSDISPAIGKGINELIWGDDTLTAPTFDKDNNSRPMPLGSMPDIGAFENQLGQPYNSNLMAYYPFNSNANDESGNGNHGTVFSATLTEDRFGNPNAAYNFNGVNNYISIPTTTSLNPTGKSGYSVSGWIKINQPAGEIFCLRGWPYQNTYEVGIGPDGYLGYCNWISPCNILLISDAPVSTNVWHFISLSMDHINNITELYLDNTLQSFSTTNISIPNFEIGSLFDIGRNTNTTTYFNGVIDDITIYGRALSVTEIDSLYHAGCNISLTLPDTLLACHQESITLDAGAGFSSYLWSTGATTQTLTVNQTGTYTVTVEDASGCSATDSTYVNIINVQIAQNDTTIIAGQSLELSLNGLTEGLVGYWPFNGNANDESGNGYHGTVNGAALSADRFGNSNRAYAFDGINDYIQTSFNGIFYNNSRTICIWSKNNLPELFQTLLFYGGHQTSWWKCQINTNNPYNPSGVAIDLFGALAIYSADVYDQDWHFYSWVYDVSFGNGLLNIKIYRDGLLLTDIAENYDPNSVIINTLPGDIDVRFGAADISFLPDYLNGSLDDIRIYNRALNQTEIELLYNEGAGTYSYLWSTGETNPMITVSPTQTTTYYVEITDGINWCTDSVTVTVEHPVELELKAFLEGPFFNDGMTPWLNFFEAIPLSQPYNASPWNYPGNESVSQIPTLAEIDWVLVELLVPSADTSNNVAFESVARKAGFILTDGWIKDVDGISNLTFTGLNTGQFYVRIHHRNHLQITSSVFIPGSNGIFTYDFTTDASKAMGGENVQKELNTGIWGMMSCDGNADGQIDNNDKNDVWLPQRNTSGYLSGDFNMDRQVSNVDKVSYWNFNAGHGIPDDGLAIVQPFTCGNPLIDTRNGQTYNTVQIGNQCWMAENLNIGTMIPGTSEMTSDGIIEKYCYDNNTANCDVYGGLYQWNEMMQYVTTEGVQGICPAGWHLPSHNEMCTLLTFLDPTVNCSDIYSHIGTDVGGKMKQTGFEHWMPPNTGATNESGFNALATGWRSTSGFSGIKFMVHYNSSTYINNTGVYIYRLDYNTQDVFLQCDQNPDTFNSGHPVRCITD